jgi:hypothetical protein
LLLVGMITASVEGLAALIVLAIDRISPPPRPAPPAVDPGTSGLHFH